MKSWNWQPTNCSPEPPSALTDCDAAQNSIPSKVTLCAPLMLSTLGNTGTVIFAFAMSSPFGGMK